MGLAVMKPGAPGAELFDLGQALTPRSTPEETQLSRLHSAYYTVKPLLPRRVQIALRRSYARLQRRSQPDWPLDHAISERWSAVLDAAFDERHEESIPLLAPWPDRMTFAYVLTHDVEGARGLAAVEPLLELEARYGVRSAWFIVGDDYPVADAVLDRLRAARCEIGVHGIHHDGEMFRDHEAFRETLPQIEEVMRRWGAVGFRSPATRRNAAWMPELGCLYDSSFPDADPFEPQPGGAGSVMPYLLGDVVELPITLPQDHTLAEILRVPAAATWCRKADWVAAMGGLVNVIVHPDYTRTRRQLAEYETLLHHLVSRPDGWHALPREVAAWWQARTDLARGAPAADGQQLALRERAYVAYARREPDGIVIAV